MMLFVAMTVACCVCLLVGMGVGAAAFKPRKTLSPVEALLDQVRWLPVLGVGSIKDREGRTIPVMTMDGGIRLVGLDGAANRAQLYHHGVLIGMFPDQEKRLGDLLTERQADRALDEAVVRLLET